MEKERISRRNFLLFGLNAALYGGFAVALGKRLYPFTGLLSENEPGTVRPESFKDLVDTRETNIFIEVEGAIGHGRVSLNKEAFSKALYDVAKYMLPEDGPERLYAVLEKRPLKVVLDPLRPEPVSTSGTLAYPSGSYIPYTMGGPGINFYGDYFQGYRRAQLANDVMMQTSYDQTVLHEIVHLVQDIRNPFDHTISGNLYRIRQAGGVLGLIQNPDIRDLPEEIEAREVSGRVAENLFSGYLAGQNPDAWPFGQYFLFS
jgi:hypothetical protein